MITVEVAQPPSVQERQAAELVASQALIAPDFLSGELDLQMARAKRIELSSAGFRMQHLDEESPGNDAVHQRVIALRAMLRIAEGLDLVVARNHA